MGSADRTGEGDAVGMTGERDPDAEDWDDYLAPAEPVVEADDVDEDEDDD